MELNNERPVIRSQREEQEEKVHQQLDQQLQQSISCKHPQQQTSTIENTTVGPEEKAHLIPRPRLEWTGGAGQSLTAAVVPSGDSAKQ